MASNKKKRALNPNGNGTGDGIEQLSELRVETDDGSDESSIGDSESEEEPMNEEINVNFEARNAEDTDFHGIVTLLQQLFLKANINTSELADGIISQNYVGSVLKQVLDIEDEEADEDDDEDDFDVFGLTTVFNITDKAKDLPSLKQVQDTLVKHGQESNTPGSQMFKEIVENKSNTIGWIINERFINIPPQIAAPTFESLSKELTRAVSKRMKYEFTHYMMICKTHKLKKKGKKSKKESDDGLFFVNMEEELFYKEAACHFSYSVKEERDTLVDGGWRDSDDEMEPFRTVIIIPGDKFPSIVNLIKESYSG